MKLTLVSYGFCNLFSIDGRSGVKEILSFLLIHTLLIVCLIKQAASYSIVLSALIFTFYSFFILVAMIFYLIRRLHDFNVSGLFALLIFIPFIGLILKFILLFIPGNNFDNNYGSVPISRKYNLIDYMFIIGLMMVIFTSSTSRKVVIPDEVYNRPIFFLNENIINV